MSRSAKDFIQPQPSDGYFVASIPVLMADGTENPIKSINVGEAVLEWNEELERCSPQKLSPSCEGLGDLMIGVPMLVAILPDTATFELCIRIARYD